MSKVVDGFVSIAPTPASFSITNFMCSLTCRKATSVDYGHTYEFDDNMNLSIVERIDWAYDCVGPRSQ